MFILSYFLLFIKPNRFQVYNFIIHHLHTVILLCIICILYCACTTHSQVFLPPCVLPLPSSTSPHPPSILAVTIVLLFWRGGCLIPSPFLSRSLPSPLPSHNCQSVLYIYESVSILFLSLFCSLDSTYK